MTEEMKKTGYIELKCEECDLVTAYVKGNVKFEGKFLCLVCAYNDPKLKV